MCAFGRIQQFTTQVEYNISTWEQHFWKLEFEISNQKNQHYNEKGAVQIKSQLSLYIWYDLLEF